MARFRADMGAIDRMMKHLSSFSVKDIAPEMLEAAGPILLEEVKEHVSAHRDTGDLEASIMLGKPKHGKDGYYISVAPHLKDRKGVRNMDKLAYLEYGTGVKGATGGWNTGIQRATPVVRPAVNAAQRRCEDAMQRVFERKCDEI